MTILTDIKKSIEKGAKLHLVISIDNHSTTYEALEELLREAVDVTLVKNAAPGHTFHPKLYLFEAIDKRAELFIGSSNLTAGGMFRNSESNIRLTFDLSGKDNREYQEFKRKVKPLLSPPGIICQKLTDGSIKLLEKTGDVIRATLQELTTQALKKVARLPTPFGSFSFPRYPTTSNRYLQDLILERKNTYEKVARRSSIKAFYMQLNSYHNAKWKSGYGEGRIPYLALNRDQAFWGWPEKYEERYCRLERRANWKIIDIDNPDVEHFDQVKMYAYKGFKFHSQILLHMDADCMDIIRLQKLSGSNRIQHSSNSKYDNICDYLCELVKMNSPNYGTLEKQCNIKISYRKFGFS